MATCLINALHLFSLFSAFPTLSPVTSFLTARVTPMRMWPQPFSPMLYRICTRAQGNCGNLCWYIRPFNRVCPQHRHIDMERWTDGWNVYRQKKERKEPGWQPISFYCRSVACESGALRITKERKIITVYRNVRNWRFCVLLGVIPIDFTNISDRDETGYSTISSRNEQ